MYVCLSIHNAGVAALSEPEGAPEEGDTEEDSEIKKVSESQGETEEEDPLPRKSKGNACVEKVCHTGVAPFSHFKHAQCLQVIGCGVVSLLEEQNTCPRTLTLVA